MTGENFKLKSSQSVGCAFLKFKTIVQKSGFWEPLGSSVSKRSKIWEKGGKLGSWKRKKYTFGANLSPKLVNLAVF